MAQVIGVISLMIAAGAIVWALIAYLVAQFPSKKVVATQSAKRACIIVVLAIGAFIAAVATDDQPPSSTEAQTVEAASVQAAQQENEATSATIVQPERLSSSQEFIWIRANQRLVSARLRDPDSARFGKDYVSYKSGAPVVCGTVNAKNAFGGFTGPEPYISGGETLGIFFPSGTKDFADLWTRLC